MENKTPSTRVPNAKNLIVVVRVQERKYEETKANKHWAVNMKLEIISPESTNVKTADGLQPHIIAGQTFTTRFMLEGKGRKSAEEALNKLGIEITSLNHEDNETLSVFDNLAFKVSLSSSKIISEVTDPETGEMVVEKDSNGKEVISGYKWEMAPWDIRELAELSM